MAAGTPATGGSGYDNTFQTTAGEALITLGANARSNTVLFSPGTGAITTNGNGSSGTVKFAAGIVAANVTVQANDSTGDLIILGGVQGDSITVHNDFGHNPWGQSTSAIRQLTFSDGQTVMAGSGWGSNTFVLAPGGDQVTFGNGLPSRHRA